MSRGLKGGWIRGHVYDDKNVQWTGVSDLVGKGHERE